MSLRRYLHSVDRLLQLAFLEGSINTHGLYEKTVLRRIEEGGSDGRLQARTVRKLLREIEAASRSMPLKTIGEFLREMRAQHQISPFAVRRRLNVPVMAYKMLENDSISPLKVPKKTWRHIRDFWKVPWEEMESMIRASHYLTVFRPSHRGTLLRYARKTGSTYPPDARLSASRELYLRARLPLPALEKLFIENLLFELRDEDGG